MVELELVEKKDLRDEYVSRVEVLDKVKKLLLMPELDMLTMRQVSDYYEVSLETVDTCYKRNKEEINSDGSLLKSIGELKVHFEPLVKTQYNVVFQVADGITINVPNRGIRMFSRRAILRIGMLLRDSDVAKEVRTQLLNVEELATAEQKTVMINEEQQLSSAVGQAFFCGDLMEIAKATCAVIAFKNRYIAELNEANGLLAEHNEELETSNKVLAKEILAWDDRASLNKAIRLAATKLQKPFGYIWKDLYDELQYKHHIGLAHRGKAPLIQHIKENEWPLVQQSFAAICEDKGISPARIIKEAKMAV